MTLEIPETDLATRYNISPFFQPGLKIVRRVIDDERPFIFVIDRSLSMGSVLTAGSTKRRWDELIERLEGTFDLLTHFPGFVAEVYLFHEHLMTVTKPEHVVDLIATLRITTLTPGTPLCQTLTKLFANHPRGNFIICSDGEATDDRSYKAHDYYSSDMYRILYHKPSSVFISWWLCSNEEDFIRYLSFLDEKILNMDLVDDFQSEVFRCGKTPLTLGSYYVKSLAAPFLPWMDDVDSGTIGNFELPPDYETSIVNRPHKTSNTVPHKTSNTVPHGVPHGVRQTTLVNRAARVVQDDRCCIIL